LGFGTTGVAGVPGVPSVGVKVTVTLTLSLPVLFSFFFAFRVGLTLSVTVPGPVAVAVEGFTFCPARATPPRVDTFADTVAVPFFLLSLVVVSRVAGAVGLYAMAAEAPEINRPTHPESAVRSLVVFICLFPSCRIERSPSRASRQRSYPDLRGAAPLPAGCG